ncbi:MAG: hypothetical protein ACJAZ0_000688 [Halioglobus sp.]|jgi:hypothetical protein
MIKEKRQHQRSSFEGKIFVERVSSDAMGSSSADIVVCKTVDISSTGIRAGIDRELPMGAILQVGIELAGEDHTLYLVGEVRWCIPSADDDEFWLVGFNLLDAQDSDIEAWQKHLADIDD